MKKFHLTENYCLANFDAINYHSQKGVVESENFELVLRAFVRKLKKNKNIILSKFKNIHVEDILSFYRLLLIYDLNKTFNLTDKINKKHQKDLYEFTEMFYDYWRSLERFGFLKGSKEHDQTKKIMIYLKRVMNLIIRLLKFIVSFLKNYLAHIIMSTGSYQQEITLIYYM